MTKPVAQKPVALKARQTKKMQCPKPHDTEKKDEAIQCDIGI